MSSYESSSAKSEREKGDSGDNGRLMCNCGVKTIQFVARQENENWGRRFFRCRNYKSNPKCFFCWIDEEFSERATEVISEGRTREKVLEAEIMKLKQHMKLEADCEVAEGK